MVQAETEKQPTVIALGNFDGLHRGHQAVIAAAVRTGLAPIVMVIHSAYSITTKPQLMAGVNALGAECEFLEFAQVQTMSGADFVRSVLVEQYHAKTLCCGYNFHFGKGGTSDVADLQRICDSLGVTLLVSPEIKTKSGEPISSTNIRKAIQAGNMEQVTQLLGHPYSFTQPVVEGDHRGRTWGLPTINQMLPTTLVVPHFGVYATQTIVNGIAYSSVTNIGIRPTYRLKSPQSETYLINFQGNLYCQDCTVLFHSFLREEQKFDSPEKLQVQIQADIAKVTAQSEKLK